MKLTAANILKFWRHWMFPPEDQYCSNRIMLRYDMPWEPWLHAGVWFSMLIILAVGDNGLIPPINGVDWVWLSFGLVAPIIGFFSVWALQHGGGRSRYYGLWGRMIADAGLATCIGTYQIARFQGDIHFTTSVLPNIVLLLSMWFTLTLVLRDVKYIVTTEKLAAALYRRRYAAAEGVGIECR